MFEIKKYTRLTPIKIEYTRKRINYWLCKCDCGNTTIASQTNLKYGHTKSCGCLRKEMMKTQNHILENRNYFGENNPNYKHGFAKTNIYRTWANMNQRCFNPNTPEYSAYGGRGITVCVEWKDSFEAFYDYVSNLPHYGEKGRSIDRINNNGNYEPGNIRWATLEQQYQNRGY